MRVWSLGQKDPLEKEMANHSSIPAWRIPWTEEPGGYSPWVCKASDTTEWLTLSHQWSHLVLDLCLLGDFWLLIQSPRYSISSWFDLAYMFNVVIFSFLLCVGFSQLISWLFHVYLCNQCILVGEKFRTFLCCHLGWLHRTAL